MTPYRGPYAEQAMFDGMMVVYENADILADSMAVLLGYMAWRQYDDFNNQIASPWANLQLKYEVMYYLVKTGLDYKKKDRFIHHILCLGYMYLGWNFKSALSFSFYFASTSNIFLSVMMKYPNIFTQICFAVSFLISRIIIGSWLMMKVLYLPVSGVSTAVIPMTGTIYVMQWWWLKKIALKARGALYPNGSRITK
jgi:hypothetical protein